MALIPFGCDKAFARYLCDCLLRYWYCGRFDGIFIPIPLNTQVVVAVLQVVFHLIRIIVWIWLIFIVPWFSSSGFSVL